MVFLVCLAVWVAAVPAAGQRVWLEAAAGPIGVGDTLAVALWLDAGPEAIGSIEAHVRLDTLVWRPLGGDVPFTSGSFWEATVYRNGRLEGAGGRLVYTAVAGSAADGTRRAATGRGVLAWLHLEGRAPADAERAAIVLEGGRRRPVYTAVHEPGRPRQLLRQPAVLAVEVEGVGAPVVDTANPPPDDGTGNGGAPGAGDPPAEGGTAGAGEAPRLQVPTRQHVHVGRESRVDLGLWVRDADTPVSALRWQVEHVGPFSVRLSGTTLLLQGLTAGEGQVELRVEDPEGNRAAALWRVEVGAGAAVPTAIEEKKSKGRTGAATAFPNPFNAAVTLQVDLPGAGPARATIWGVNGQRLRTYETRGANGRWSVVWDGRDAAGRAAASGLYLYRVESGTWQSTGKLLLLR